MSKKTKTYLLGAHMPIADGLTKTLEDAESIGCTTIQIFSKSPRQWKDRALDPEVVKAFRQQHQNSTVGPIAVHASYLINIGSPKPESLERSIDALKEELKRCDQLGVDFLVLHPGSALHSTPEECIQTIAASINAVFASLKSKTTLLLETTAGQGTNVGHSFEQLNAIIAQITNKSRIGVCLDTCHIYAAGYDFSTPNGYNKTWSEFDETIGMSFLKLIHLNDSATPLGSKKDRHAHIGEGHIGLEAFRLLMNDKNLASIPKILETPKDSLEEDATNLKALVDLIAKPLQPLVENSPLKMYLKR